MKLCVTVVVDKALFIKCDSILVASFIKNRSIKRNKFSFFPNGADTSFLKPKALTYL